MLLHNGTIFNYEDLAKKYIPDIDIKGMTDSQVMAQIFYYKGYDALEEYQGGAAFVIVDYRHGEPETLLFHGKTKDFSYSQIEEEERPLYFLIDDDTLYFSSIYQILETFVRDKQAYIVPYNTLCRFDKDCIRSVKKVDRSKCTQKKAYTAKTYGSFYDYSSDYYNDYITCDVITNTYKLEQKPITGKQFISNFGRVEKQKYASSHECYFYYGYVLGSKKAYTFLVSLTNSLKTTPEKFIEKYRNLVAFLSLDRIYFDSKDNLWKKATGWNTSEVYSGKMQQITSTIVRNIKDGIMQTVVSYDSNLIPYEVNDVGVKYKDIYKAIKNESNS